MAPLFARPRAPGYRPSPVRRCGGCPGYFQRKWLPTARTSPMVIRAACPCRDWSGPDILAAPHPWIPAFAGKTKRGLAGLFSYQSSMPAAADATDHENGSRLRVRVRWSFAPRAPVGIGVAPLFARPRAPGYRPSPVRRCGGCPGYFQRKWLPTARTSPMVIRAACPCRDWSGPVICAAPCPWIPAFAGKTMWGLSGLFSEE